MNQAALITGGSRGIGRGIGLELAPLGFDLLINYRSNQSAAEETADQCRQTAVEIGKRIRVEICPANIAHAPERERMLSTMRERFGRLDLLVNNAGVAPRVRADILEGTEESFDELIQTNVKGPYFLTQRAANWMIDLRKTLGSDYHPKIVTISSVSAYAASSNRGDYCISKAALSMLTPLFAARLAEHGIHVFEIRPGVIATDMTSAVHEKYDRLIEQGLTPIKRWGQAEDVGRAVAAIARDSFPFSTGEVINVDGGFHLRRL